MTVEMKKVLTSEIYEAANKNDSGFLIVIRLCVEEMPLTRIDAEEILRNLNSGVGLIPIDGLDYRSNLTNQEDILFEDIISASGWSISDHDQESDLVNKEIDFTVGITFRALTDNLSNFIFFNNGLHEDDECPNLCVVILVDDRRNTDLIMTRAIEHAKRWHATKFGKVPAIFICKRDSFSHFH